MKQLDDRVNTLQQQVHDDCIKQLQHISKQQAEVSHKPSKRHKVGKSAVKKDVGSQVDVVQSGLEDKELARKIDQNMNEIIQISEEKMKRAQQIYDLVDQHIRKLDKDLKSFGAEVTKERTRLGIQPVIPSSHKKKREESKRKRAGGLSTGTAPIVEQGEETKTPEQLYQEALAVADPNEPKYCYCQRISFGEMIACENEDCPIEWFHFSCVGLTPENRPKGQWFCNECKAAMQARK